MSSASNSFFICKDIVSKHGQNGQTSGSCVLANKVL